MSTENAAKADETFSTLLRMLGDWGHVAEAICQKNVDDFLSNLIKKGWRRRDIYNLLQKTTIPSDFGLTSEAIDYVCDIESAVTGFIHPDCIMRFPDEEFKDNEEMIAYVRSKAWMK